MWTLRCFTPASIDARRVYVWEQFTTEDDSSSSCL